MHYDLTGSMMDLLPFHAVSFATGFQPSAGIVLWYDRCGEKLGRYV